LNVPTSGVPADAVFAPPAAARETVGRFAPGCEWGAVVEVVVVVLLSGGDGGDVVDGVEGDVVDVDVVDGGVVDAVVVDDAVVPADGTEAAAPLAVASTTPTARAAASRPRRARFATAMLCLPPVRSAGLGGADPGTGGRHPTPSRSSGRIH
jgi:hypothetical protein